jgi:glucose uptake protein
MYGFLAGMLFNLGNMLLMGAVSVAGMAVAFPMTAGFALLLGTVIGSAGRPAGNTMLLGLGCALIFTATVVNAVLYRMMGVAQHEVLARAGQAKSTRRPSPWKGIVLCLVAGLLIGSFTPLLDKARVGDLGLGPYALGAIFAFGVFFSSFVFDIFFMNLPVEGDPVDFGAYFSGTIKQHGMGVVSGILWCTGILAAMVATSVPESLQTSLVARYLLLQAGPVVAALWGILVFREFKGNDVRVKALGALMLVLFLCGLVLIGLAPMYLRKVA